MSGNSLLHLEKTDRRPFPYPCGENLSRTEKRAGEERKANRPEPQRLCRTPARSRHDPASFMPARSCGVCRWQPGLVYKGGQFILKDWRKIRPYPIRPCDSFRQWKSFLDVALNETQPDPLPTRLVSAFLLDGLALNLWNTYHGRTSMLELSGLSARLSAFAPPLFPIGIKYSVARIIGWLAFLWCEYFS